MVKAAAGSVRELFPRLSGCGLDAGYSGKGKSKDWVEKGLERTAEVVRLQEVVGLGSRRSGVSAAAGFHGVLPRWWVESPFRGSSRIAG